MKILIDLTSLADNFSGIERYAACLAKEMIENKDHEFILVFKNSIHPLFSGIENKKNVAVKVLHGGNKLLFNQILLPAYIYTVSADAYVFLAFPVPVLLFKKNMVETIHDICCWDCPETMSNLSKWYFRISHRIASLKCKAIITISEFSRDRIISKLNYNKERLWLIYCGLSEVFEKFTYDEKRAQEVKNKYALPDRYLLCLSTLEPRKNMRLLVEAFQELTIAGKIDCNLVLAGRKGWKIENLLSGLNPKVAEKIVVTGFIDDADLPYVYQKADCFVFPSLYEGFGIPPLEAMAMGIPVISSDSSSLPEVLGNEAIYFKNNDKESLKASLLSLKNMSTVKTEQIKAHAVKFNWAEQAERLIKLINELGC